MFGQVVSIPFGIAPTAMHCLVHPEGELNSVRGAVTHNTIFCASTLATKGLEEISNAAFTLFKNISDSSKIEFPRLFKPHPIKEEYFCDTQPVSPEQLQKMDPIVAQKMKRIIVCPSYDSPPKSETAALSQPHLWYQLYLTVDRNTTINLINLAKNSGYQALVLTVDAPILGKRERDQRQNFTLPTEYSLKNLERFSNNMSVKGDKESGSGLLKLFAEQVDKTFTWKDLQWIKQNSLGMPIILKGI